MVIRFLCRQRVYKEIAREAMEIVIDGFLLINDHRSEIGHIMLCTSFRSKYIMNGRVSGNYRPV